MTLTPAFRLSTYVPLAVAAAALGYAEASLLPEVGVFAVLVLFALVFIHRSEAKMRPLTASETNRLGIVISVAAVLWAGFRIIREANTNEFATIGWVAFFVALIAPILLALVCALLIRPQKKPGDYWFMQAAGLASIVLAGAMAEQTIIVVLTAMYALAMVWFLAEFHLARQGSEPRAGRPRIMTALGWLGGAAFVALPLYLLTPRSPFDKLEFGSGRIEIGYAADQMIDLTQTGELQENPETAFEVQVMQANGQPKEDLDPNQRWRGSVLATYAAGTWRRETQALFPTTPVPASQPEPWSPPDFGASAFQVEFTVPSKLRSRFLLDPVVWDPDKAVPVAELTGGRVQPWLPMSNGRLFGRNPATARADEREFRYVQFSRPPNEPDLSPGYTIAMDVNQMLIAYPVPRVKEYTDRVVADLVAAGRLPEDVRKRDEVHLRVPEHRHEDVARALREHLAEHAGLSYTTNLKRINKSVDPVEDFLLHSKAGHCERFATALVLMLRSQGIPSVMVLGFKGCEHVGGGKYLVRQEYAHAWAEALVSRPGPDPRRRVHHWLSLDPSPMQAQEQTNGGASDGWSLAAFERFIFSNSPEQRERALAWLVRQATDWRLLAGLAAFVSLLALGRRWRRRSFARAAVGGTEWFRLLESALIARGIAPDPGETALEFARRAEAALPAALADVPVKWVELHYRERFGGAAPDPDEREELEHRLQELGRVSEAR